MTDEELQTMRAELRRDGYLSDGNAYPLLDEVDLLRAENRRLVEAITGWEKKLRRMTMSTDGFPVLAEMRAAIEKE